MDNCSVAICDNVARAKGYCSTHLSRLRRGMDLFAPVKRQFIRTSELCSYRNCTENYYCKGLCSFHYKRSIAGVPLDQPRQVKSYGKPDHVCPQCSTRFTSKPSEASRRKYCSRRCSQSTKSGAENQNWKGGLTSANSEERNRFAREVRALVFQRDSYTCQICEATDSGNLHVDHIKHWSEYPELRFELSNCRTLCRPCHYYITLKRKMPVGSLWGLTNLRSNNL